MTVGLAAAGSGAACDLSDVVVAPAGRLRIGPVSLRVAPGEAVALVGASGAGKTTLLHVLAGLRTPSSGTARVAGRAVGGLRDRHERARLVGIVTQGLDLVPQLTVKHNVQAGALGRWTTLRALAALLVGFDHVPALAAAERVGITALWRERVGTLSGGEQQRVAVARLLVQDPAVVLADEPVAALDPALADDVLTLLCATRHDGRRAVVASLHDPALARRHFDRVIGLRGGRVAFDLPSDDVDDGRLEALYGGAGGTPPPQPVTAR